MSILDYVFHPEDRIVYGMPPFKFMWESIEELTVENKSAGKFYSGVFANAESPRSYVGTFEISPLFLQANDTGTIRVLRVSDNTEVYSWVYKFSSKYI